VFSVVLSVGLTYHEYQL